ncbi:MAG: MFS transporter [Bacilli bacterium]
MKSEDTKVDTIYVRQKNKLTKKEWYWILYDVGNSAFTMVACSLFALYFQLLCDDYGISTTLGDSYWAYATATVTVIAVLLGPLVGALSDMKGFRKPIFMTFTILGVLGCVALGLPMYYILWLVIYVVTKVVYSGALMIYDSMLGDTTSDDKMDKVSSYGYALGYIGSVIPFIIGVAIVALGFGDTMEESLGVKTGYIIAFAINALWWLVFSIPLFRTYKQKNFVPKHKHVIGDSYKRIFQTFKLARKNYAGVFLFLIAFFFYIDSVYSIIDLAIKIAGSLGDGTLDSSQALIVLIVVQFIAFPSAIAISKLSKKFNTEVMIGVCIIGYLFITVFAVFISAMWMFWFMAVCIGLFQGGIQSLSRSYFSQIIPRQKSGELFGLYDVFGKGASFLGAFLFGVINSATGSANLGLIPLSILVFIGFIFFILAVRYNRRHAAEIAEFRKELPENKKENNLDYMY